MIVTDAVKTIIQTMFRFFPFSTETGLRVIGQPGPDSPVLLTCNFELTVIRVTRALKGLDCYLLVAPSKGINVWCASGGGMLNAHSVTSVLKTSGIAEKVEHRTLILPQFSAPGIDVVRVEEETGWRCRFGPAYARDIPDYVAAGYQKTEAMRQARFPLGDRLEMAVMWATPMSIVAAIPLAIFALGSLPGVLALIWGFTLFRFCLLRTGDALGAGSGGPGQDVAAGPCWRCRRHGLWAVAWQLDAGKHRGLEPDHSGRGFDPGF